jgi:hypothetical protein
MTVDSAGAWIVYQTSLNEPVTKISISEFVLTVGTAVLSLPTAVMGLPSGKTFPAIDDKIFRLCVYPAGF